MICTQRTTLNAGTMIEEMRLHHRATQSRAAGSFFGHDETFRDRSHEVGFWPLADGLLSAPCRNKQTFREAIWSLVRFCCRRLKRPI